MKENMGNQHSLREMNAYSFSDFFFSPPNLKLNYFCYVFSTYTIVVRFWFQRLGLRETVIMICNYFLLNIFGTGFV